MTDGPFFPGLIDSIGYVARVWAELVPVVGIDEANRALAETLKLLGDFVLSASR